MALRPGTRLGAYEIHSLLGAGGMGEVYRATDTKLDRIVAIKVLPETFAQNQERVARFEREAKLLASLSHPNIATIHGVEEADGVQGLVLELVEGPTLAERIAEGPIPVEEALPVARQIAEALEAGHDAGVIHRDLKPANVKLKEDGTVKVLDYGLAKMLEGESPAGTDSKLSQSPTLTRQGTQMGVILGTAAYMSPEQAKGKRVDRRTDIWAFGAVVFEMLSGKRAFAGEDISDTLAAVLRQEIDWSALPADTPESIRRLLRRCLSRELDRRLPHIGAARLELREAKETPSVEAVAPAAPRNRVFALVLSTAVGLAVGLVLFNALDDAPAPPKPIRASIDLPPETALAFGPAAHSQIAVSRDGAMLAVVTIPLGGTDDSFSGSRELNGYARIHVIRLDTGESRLIPDTEGAFNVFFSPDGRWLGFFAQGELKKVSLSGGAPISLCPVENPWGATWTEDDQIVFSNALTGREGLMVVSANGGEPSAYSINDDSRGEVDHSFPASIPGRSELLITMWAEGKGVYADARVGWLPSGGSAVHLIDGGSHPHVVDETLVYARAPRLLAVPFDAAGGRLVGESEIVVDGVLAEPAYDTPQFTLSPSGVLVWAAGGLVEAGRLARFDPNAEPSHIVILVDEVKVRSGSMFPGDGLLALEVTGANGDEVYAYDSVSESLTRLAPGRFAIRAPVPDPSGEAIFYDTHDRGVFRHDLRQQSPDRLSDGTGSTWLSSVSKDGLYLAYEYTEEGRSDSDIGVLDLSQQGARHPLIMTQALERAAMFSPTDFVLAYESNRSDRVEIWLQRFDPAETSPVSLAPVRVSRAGGRAPFWSPDGSRLYFVNANRLWVSTIRTSPELSATRPVEVLDLWRFLESRPQGIGRLDIFGQDREGRFLAVASPPLTSVTQLEAIFHWQPLGGRPESKR
ncbi:MAG TPA: protein kinase [Vicinamibacteria bacterium]|nr:protein kinase [Vicinamibacteria bacterium]